MDFEHEHAKGAGGICPGCRKMEEPKLVSCQILLLTFLILPHHIIDPTLQPKQLPVDGKR